MNVKYAIVCDRIEQYQDGSVHYEPSEYNPETILVHWVDAVGNHCVCKKESFRIGSLEELQEIINSDKRELDRAIEVALNKFPNASHCQKELVKCLIKDGYAADEISEDMLNGILSRMEPYFECNGNFEDAYFNYMH